MPSKTEPQVLGSPVPLCGARVPDTEPRIAKGDGRGLELNLTLCRIGSEIKCVPKAVPRAGCTGKDCGSTRIVVSRHCQWNWRKTKRPRNRRVFGHLSR